MRQGFVFVSDTHAPFHDRRCIALAAARTAFLKPAIVIYGGDILDCYLEGRFVRVGSRITKMTQEIAGAVEVLDTIAAAAPKAKKYYIEANHEFRHKIAIATMGQVPGYLEDYPGLSLESALGLKERGIQYIHSKGGNASIKIGPLLFAHGERYGTNPARMELMDNLCSGVSGHVHRMTEARISSSTSGVDWKWLTSGCLSMPAHYKDRTNEHLGFVSGWLDEEENTFHLQHETIHADANGTATLYAPEGTYKAWTTSNGGIAIRRDTDTPNTSAQRPSKNGKRAKKQGPAKSK